MAVFSGTLDAATVSSDASHKSNRHETNAECLLKVQSHGRNDTRATLTDAREAYQRRHRGDNFGVNSNGERSTAVVVFGGGVDGPTASSCRRSIVATDQNPPQPPPTVSSAEAAASFLKHGRTETHGALSVARTEFERRRERTARLNVDEGSGSGAAASGRWATEVTAFRGSVGAHTISSSSSSSRVGTVVDGEPLLPPPPLSQPQLQHLTDAEKSAKFFAPGRRDTSHELNSTKAEYNKRLALSS